MYRKQGQWEECHHKMVVFSATHFRPVICCRIKPDSVLLLYGRAALEKINNYLHNVVYFQDFNCWRRCSEIKIKTG